MAIAAAIHIRCKPLTPVWTGDAEGKGDVLLQLEMECSVVIVVGETFHGEPGQEAMHG